MGTRGFTLIELMVVMTIMGLLIIVGVASYTSVQTKSRDGRRKSDLRQIASALEAYYNDYSTYPPNDPNTFGINGCGTTGTASCVWESAFQTLRADGVTVKTMYMPKLPGDPASGRRYYYMRSGTNPPSYQLYAMLENVQDRDYSATIVAKGLGCGGGVCNYGVSSSNITP